MKTRNAVLPAITGKILPNLLLLLLGLLCLRPAPVHATVTPVAWWRLGENDAGTVTNGAPATATTNLLGGGVMNLVGGPTYTTNVSSAAAAADGSTLGLKFPGSNSYGTNALFANLTNNFGIELWVNPAANSATACLAYNGNSSGNGWGLYLIGGQFKGLFGLVASFGSAPATLNTWTHLALVRNNGTNILYVNGVANVTNTVSPNLPAGIFAVGAQAQSLTTEFLNGALDEVRVFTFAPGGFTTNDLLLNSHIVTVTNDAGAGSLRTTVANAPAGTIIIFAPNLSGQTITLTNGQISLSKNVTIDGSALPDGIAISGNNASRIFYNNGAVAVMNSLSLENGYATNGGGGIYLDTGSLILNYSTITNNTSDNNGGGIYNLGGTLTVNNSTLVKNSCGGGNYGGGGGIFSEATLIVNNSTIANNISGANSSGGGLVNFQGTLIVDSSTIVGNSAGYGAGGIFNYVAVLNLTNSIVCSNSAPAFPNLSGTYMGNNNLLNTDALLAPLGNYGGPTMTMPPLPGSPAIDAGNDAAASSLVTDQRGFPRKAGAHVDVGAVEVQVASAGNPPVLGNAAWSATGGGGGKFQFRFTNSAAADFTVLMATNVALPLTNWTVLGNAAQPLPGQYQFTDAAATNGPQQFYRVVSP